MQLLDVQCQGRLVQALQLLSKAGVVSLPLRVLVDASGDLDAMQRAGARFLPLQAGEELQPATHAAHAAVRVMTISLAMGHAAGIVAALGARDAAGAVRAVDCAALRATLQAQGAVLA